MHTGKTLSCHLFIILSYEQVMRVDVTQYSLMYALYAWPSIVVTLAGGVLIDKWLGLRLSSLLFLSLICLGQVSLHNFFVIFLVICYAYIIDSSS